MTCKRGKIVLFSIIFLVLILGIISAQEEQEKKSFFSRITSTITGWVSSLANIFLEIQANIRAPDVNIYVLNQSTRIPTLNWSVSNCEGYYIWYSENITEILQISYNNSNESILAPNVTLVGSTNTTWDDTNAPSVSQRYYVVGAYNGNFTTTSNKVGKWDILINDEDNITETFFSFPLEENISIYDIPFPDENFAVLYTINHSLNDTWQYAYNYLGVWDGEIYGMDLDFGRGHLATAFSNDILLTNTGDIPTGNVTEIIYAEDNIGHTSLGWESITTNGNISELIIPQNNFAVIYSMNYASNQWTYIYYYNGVWSTDFQEFEAGHGYLFDGFTIPINFTYERNPY